MTPHLETHRDGMTTDLYFSLRLLDHFPALRLTGDLSHSHFVVGSEFAWQISGETYRVVQRVIDHCCCFDGRAASREQIQLQLPSMVPSNTSKTSSICSRAGGEYRFRSWGGRAPQDAVLTSLCEHGPRKYAMTGADGYERSDRWQESQLLIWLVRELWRWLEPEAKPYYPASAVP